MDLTTPPKVVAALAEVVRKALVDAVGPLLGRGSEPRLPAVRSQASTVVVTAAAPFAPTPQARLRLLRQMHASGLLTARESADAAELIEGVG